MLIPEIVPVRFDIGMQTNHPKASLIEHFQSITAPRVNRAKDHGSIDILIIAICTLVCAGESFNDMEDFGRAKFDWFKSFLRLRSGISSRDTFNRVFAALDGKALRRALRAGRGVQHVVRAWAESNRLVLGQLKVEDKSNEIRAWPTLVRALELAGWIVTVDVVAERLTPRAEGVTCSEAAENLATLRRPAFNLRRREEKPKSGYQGQAVQRRLGSCLPPADPRNLDASDLVDAGSPVDDGSNPDILS